MNLDERKAAFRARTERYLRLGHDDFAAARFVAEAAGGLDGPVLDVGTGKGVFAMALARRGLDVVSVDVNAEDSELAAALARDAGLDGRIRFLLHDARSLPFPDGSFGCAAMMEVLHHLDDARPVLAEMVRVVRPGGTVVVADFVEEGFALVDSVHRAEGREHPRSGCTLAGAKEFLASLNWIEEGRAEAHHDAVAWFRRRARLAPKVIPLDLARDGYQPLLHGRPETAGMRSGLVVLAPGASVGRHDTGAHEEQLVVLEGEGEFRAEGATPLAIHAATAVYCPPHHEHDVINTGPGALRYVYVVAEAHQEQLP